ncbi:MAG: ATPase, T2SS/T4P/T4SS family [Smithellaceae bacterium]
MAKITTFIKKPPKKDELSEAPQVEELLRNLEFHKSIQNLSNRILGAETIAEIIVSLKEDIRKLFNIHILTIYLIDRPAKEIYTMEADGDNIREVRFPISYATFAGYVTQKKKLLYIADPYNERDLRKIHEQLVFDRSRDRKTGVLTGQIIATPIAIEGVLLGVMEIINKKGGDKIEDYHQIYLDEISGVLAKAFDNQFNFYEEKQKFTVRFEPLLKKGFLNDIQLEKALRTSHRHSQPIEDIFMDQYGVSKDDIGKSLADYYHCRFVPYDSEHPVPDALLTGLEKAALEKMRWVPIDVINGKIHVITDDPSDMIKRKNIEGMLGTNAIAYDVATATDIASYLDLFFQEQKETRHNDETQDNPAFQARHIDEPLLEVDDAITTAEAPEEEMTASSEIEIRPESDPTPVESLSQTNEDMPVFGEQSPQELPIEPEAPVDENIFEEQSLTVVDAGAAQRVSQIINEAYGRRASDIHFEPDAEANNVTLRIRIDGQCILHQTMTDSEYETIIAQIKIMAKISPQAKGVLQSAKIRFLRPAGGDLDMRIVIIPTRAGQEDAVIHILPKIKKMPLELIGLSEKTYAILTGILEKPTGLILIAGPAGTGITTTLHACLSHINQPGKKIWTAEQPIDITDNGLRQAQIDPQKGLTFPKLLRSIFAADPDVIMASHLHDIETARLCLEAAMKRNLVLSSLSAESATESMERLLDMGIPHLALADATLAIISQRLIRTLCPKCKEPYHPGREEYDELAELYGAEAFEQLNIPYTDDFVLFRPNGCNECAKTGYSGHTGIFEILVFSHEIKRRIRRKESADAVYDAALSDKMVTLRQDWIYKILEGLTDSARLKQTLLV